jgi:hypothetical protein
MAKIEEIETEQTSDTNKSFLISFLMGNRRYIFMTLVLFILFGIISYKMVGKNKDIVNNNYFVAERAFAKWQKGDDVAMMELRKVLDIQPGLKPKYNGQLVQGYLNNHNATEAVLLSSNALKGIKMATPLYERYSYASLLISQSQYEEARQEAYALKGAMDSESVVYNNTVLFAFNLFRISVLEKALNNPEKELAALESLESLVVKPIADDNKATLAMDEFIETFTKENKINLLDYIRHRKRALTS